MTPGIETSIWLAIKSRIETIPLQYEKAYPGMTFEVPHDAGKLLPFLRIGRSNAGPVGVFVEEGKQSDRRGSIIVTLVYPLGQDTSVYVQQASEIAKHFIDGTKMRYGNICVKVADYPQVQEGYEDTAYWNTPVRIKWKCYA